MLIAISSGVSPSEGMPIGQWIRIDAGGGIAPPRREVIGVVGNSRHESLAQEADPEFYVPFPQQPVRDLDFVVRASAWNLTGLDAAVRRAVRVTG